MIRYSAIFARRHGESTPYVLAFSFDPNSQAIYARHQEITDGARGAAFRAEHAEIEVIKENTHYAHHDFPDPGRLEEQRKQGALAEAHRVRNEAVAARAVVASAELEAKARASAIGTLTDEQKEMLAEHDAREEKKQRLIDEAQAEKLRLAAEKKAREEEEQLRREIELEEKARRDTDSAQQAARENAEQAQRVLDEAAAEKARLAQEEKARQEEEQLRLEIEEEERVKAEAERARLAALQAPPATLGASSAPPLSLLPPPVAFPPA